MTMTIGADNRRSEISMEIKKKTVLIHLRILLSSLENPMMCFLDFPGLIYRGSEKSSEFYWNEGRVLVKYRKLPLASSKVLYSALIS